MHAQVMIEWRNQSETPALGQSEIHVWRINLGWPEADESLLPKCLSAEENDRATRFHFLRDRRRFLIRRFVLRHLLAQHLGLNAGVVRLVCSPNGKPFVSGQDGPKGVRFSCSHSGDLALVAIARGRELGVDLEQNRPMTDILDLVNACFSQREITAWQQQPDMFKLRCFFDVWTRKEAFVKAIGQGLLFPLKDVSVSLMPDQPAKLIKVENIFQALERWDLMSLDVGPDYSAALVHENKNACVQYFEWTPNL